MRLLKIIAIQLVLTLLACFLVIRAIEAMVGGTIPAPTSFLIGILIGVISMAISLIIVFERS